MKKLLSLFALVIVSILTISMVSAVGNLPVDLLTLKINDNVVKANENLYVEEGETLDIEVKVFNNGMDTAEDVEVEAAIKGYEYSDKESVSDSSHVFDLDAGDSRWVDLSITLPSKLDKDLYLLRIRVTDKNSIEVSQTYNLKINPTRHGLDIKDVIFSPGKTVQAGYSLLATVLVENYGGKDESDVKVTIDVPGLGISASDYISSIDSDDKKTSEELFLKLPLCAKKGDYQAKVTLDYDNAYETVTKYYTLSVTENDKCTTANASTTTAADKLVVAVGPDQKVTAGQQVVYPLTFTNAGTTSKTYLLELTTGSWATSDSKLSESLVVLEAGATKTVYAYLTPDSKTAAGEKVASLTIKSDNTVLKTIYLKTDVTAKPGMSLKSGLEIALIVLVVILVIVGLVLGFSRLKKDEDVEEEGEDKTYY